MGTQNSQVETELKNRHRHYDVIIRVNSKKYLVNDTSYLKVDGFKSNLYVM